jgi:hypothetical protein
LGLLLVLGMLTAILPLGAVAPASAAPQDLVITGVVDGPLTGGIPKAVELYVVNDIADLSTFGLGSANNGGGTDGQEFVFDPDAASAGSYIYVATEAVAFADFFGFAPDYTSAAASVNGDDAIELFENGVVVDVFGDIAASGSGTAWDYLDGWAYRVPGTGPDGSTFVLSSWTFSGVNALDDETTNASAATPFPIGTYGGVVVEPTDPTGTGTATPAAVDPGETTTLEVTVVPGTNPDSTGITVTADLTAIGGSATQDLANAGGTVFSYLATVDAGTAPGPVSLPVSISDTEGRSGNTSIALTVTDPTPAPTQLLLTQYVEGSSFNKAIEIANLGTGDVDLSGYTLELYSNGSATVSQSTTLAGTLAGGDVYVIANPSASAAILAVADTTNGSVINWNGDDAIVLRNADGVVDSIGQVGFDPGSAWSANGVSTQNDTMCRLDTVTSGDTDPSDVFDPSLEWTGLGEDVLWGLGEIGCEPPVAVTTMIHDIQGSGLTSPLEGQTVAIEGIVTADFQDGAAGTDGDLDGYYVQEEDADVDGDPATSEGILVYDPTTVLDVAVGDLVQLTGTVTEFGSSGSLETELGFISNVSILSSGNALPTVTEVLLPYNDVADLEAYEGMYVGFGVSQPLYITEYFNFDRFNEIVIATDPRPSQPTAVYEPGSTDAADLADLNARSRITLDDGRSTQNPVPARHPDGSEFSAANSFRGGDQLNNVVGVLADAFGLYRIQPTDGATYTALNARTSAPDEVGGTIQVASFNVLNYFTTIDEGAFICGPAENLECRGADSVEELDRQRTKIVEALAAIDADIVGLIEIENHVATTVDEPLDNLVASLNAVVGAGTYDYVHTGSIGTDAIKVALVYKTASVTPSGAYEILDSSVDPLFDDTRSRPALAQSFTENGTANEVTVVVNHLKSKGSACGEGDDDPEQGNCNLTRTNAATALVNWLAGFEGNVLAIGDMNSYDKEDPIDVFIAGGYADLALDFIGEDAYSYVFSGQWGYLDYALANSSLQPFVTGTTIWHINSDEPDLLDYDTSFNDPMFYSPDAYRSSDHDPVIIGLDLTPPDTTGPVVTAEFDKLLVGFTTGLFQVDFSCVDDVDPDPACVGDINGIAVEDGQKVFLIQTPYGRSWHHRIGSILYIKDSSFTLTVTGTDEAGNTVTVTAEPEFRTWHRSHQIW